MKLGRNQWASGMVGRISGLLGALAMCLSRGSWAVVTGQLGEWLVGYKTPLLPSPGPSIGIWR